MVSQVSKLSAIRKASRWQRGKVAWHFHLLSPGCLFNPTKTHELFLESSKGNYVVRSHGTLTEIAKHLVQLLHGRDITEFSSSPASGTVEKLLKQAKELNQRRVKWHHHLLFPHCMFNKKWGKWILAFEDPLNNKLTELVYPHFPEKDLRKVENLFYGQRK
ncbi:MAG: hypothetical protein Q8R15_00195 [Candidatus Micrarchaeota archaeon]|nr:hypothetical protein [Candidatus Micrarchaeota archaeon]